jgi:hypothetical protein
VVEAAARPDEDLEERPLALFLCVALVAVG